MNTDRTNQTLELEDGRTLGYAEYGAEDGKPVFVFHGFPGSRLTWPAFDPNDCAGELGLRIIAPERPGYGLSDFQPGRELLDWPDDVVALADLLGIDRFAVLGLSGGGPFASVCAYKIPDRLEATALVVGMGPADAPGIKDGDCWTFPGKGSLKRRLLLWLTAMVVRKKPDKFIEQMVSAVSAPDRRVLEAHPEVASMFTDDWREAFRSGVRGAHYESTLYKRPWGFRLQDVSADVHLWHGTQDNNVPVSVGRSVAETIPQCHATFIEDEGHFSLPYKHLRDILSVLAG